MGYFVICSEWSYIGFGQRHIGAMAQDFHAQFPLNEDDKALNDADPHGVALAALNGNLTLEPHTPTIARVVPMSLNAGAASRL